MPTAEERLHLRLEADKEHELGRPGDELAQGVAGEPGLESLRECLLHLHARWYPLHGVVGSFLRPFRTVRCGYRKDTLRRSILTPSIGRHRL